MPAVGYTPIQLYRSSTASAAPTAGNLQDGELAINTLDEKVYFKNSSAVVKQILTADATQTATNKTLTGQSLTYFDKGNSGTSTQTLSYLDGSHQKITATGTFTIATSNWPAAGKNGELLLELANGGSQTITWPTINWIKPDGTTTTSIATYLAANTGRTALQSAGTDFFILWTRDAGTIIYGKLV